jgi:decaprenylphospho-beta-D-erythro-pentofuranosid-2-ulose 2-reductase
VLVGRSPQRLAAVADDLRARQSECTVVGADFDDPAAILQLAAEITSRVTVDIVLIAHGALPDQQACQSDLALARDALVINGLSPVLFAEAFAGPMQRAGSGVIALLGSVAGDRGRKSNYVYGAAKGLVDVYAQGLQHRLAGSGVTVLLVKPGPVDTPMTAHLKTAGGKLADVRAVAADIVAAVGAGRRRLYTPRIWALIMLVVRNIPQRLFNRMNI